MSVIGFLAEWAVRSAVMILGGALILWATRVKAAPIRLAAWTAMLGGSLAIPALIVTLPKIPVAVVRVAVPPVAGDGVPAPALRVEEFHASKPFDWARAVLIGYALIAAALLVRIGTGLLMTSRLRRASRSTDQAKEGIEIRESDSLSSPVTLGIVRPVILLPNGWRQWDSEKLDAVLTHERSHIQRYDPAVQLVSAIHRAMLWFSPLSWFLHQRLVRVAEEASDDAAVESTGDRAFSAKVLLEFMQRGANGVGVPMARYGRADDRIHRILDGKMLSRRLTRWSVAAILGLGLPLAYLAAAAGPPAKSQPQARVPKNGHAEASAVTEPSPGPEPGYLMALGSVAATTVTIGPRVDGELTSVNFKEGEVVQAGQLLATIDPHPYQLRLAQAEAELAREKAQSFAVTANRNRLPEEQVAQADGILKAARHCHY